MKPQLFILAALCLMACGANAQTEKGKSFINGSIGFTSNKNNQIVSTSPTFSTEQKAEAFNIMPRFGYFVADNLTIGLGAGYVHSKSTVNTVNTASSAIILATQTGKQHVFSIEPFVRKYVDVADKFKFFGEFNLGVGFGKAINRSVYSAPINSSSEDNYKLTSYGAALSPGFAFFPSKKWAIEFSFPLASYRKTKPKDVSNGLSIPTTETFSFATDSFNPSIGFNFHF
ncbi:autotransporter outer membrane beta-barrel domain-containing protein [Pedobacter sp. ASV12]|uniref:autotransporter outer membrane beta-barrel domain-containing protein n=1 Tax=Pedobacter sp. ASV12 TaxID=2795120 RepID=UPI0018EC0B96|nr:autotransporter outer membrane beta-barrel domain-containing protein [Pedobacter sp. ASV12]